MLLVQIEGNATSKLMADSKRCVPTQPTRLSVFHESLMRDLADGLQRPRNNTWEYHPQWSLADVAFWSRTSQLQSLGIADTKGTYSSAVCAPYSEQSKTVFLNWWIATQTLVPELF